MNIEEKAKAYDDALKRMKSWARGEHPECFTEAQKTAEFIFPELKESEDDRIRKAIIEIVKKDEERIGVNAHLKKIQWLEKQGKQKPVFEMKTPEESLGIDSYTYNKIVDECIYGEQKPADKSEPTDYNSIDPHFGKPTDKIEPKFKVDDWVVYDHNAYQVVELPKEGYINLGLKRNGKIEFAPSPYCRPWTIQDAKDGDVLVTREKKRPFIFKKYDEDTDYVYAYCGICDLVKDNSFHTDDDQLWTCYSVAGDVYPATKEQRDQLEKAMTDAGYTFNFEKKELKKIEQKPAWSEEDEVKINRIVACLENLNVADNDILLKDVDWLKSLRP